MKRITSLNHWRCRSIINHASSLNVVQCYTILFNSRTYMFESLFIFLFEIVLEICPPTYKQFKQLHPQIQSYMNIYFNKLYEQNKTHS